MKNKLTLLLALALIMCFAFALASCGATDTDTDSNASTETEEKHEHTEEIIPAVAATCTTKGLTEGKRCYTCGEILVEQQGIPRLEHVEEIIPSVDSTCMGEGLTEGKKCALCNEILLQQKAVNPKGHIFENSYTCIVCRETLVESEGLKFELNANGTSYSVVGIGNCRELDLVIPYTHNNLPITSIGDEAFYDCIWIKSVIIPQSIESIGKQAFYGCYSLTNLTIVSGVTNIGKDAFYSCNTTSMNYLGTIEQWCSISFDGKYANPVYGADNQYINGELLIDLIIPSTVTEIRDYAFSGGNFTSILLPNSITSIGDYAFDDCVLITSIEIPNSVTAIGDHAFGDCKSITSIEIPNSVTAIGAGAFINSWKIYKLNYLGTIEEWCSISFGGEYANPLYYADYLYLNGELVTDLIISNTITGINDFSLEISSALKYNEYDNAYYLGNQENPYLILVKAKNNDITSCVINESTKFICNSAFYYCECLKEITIPNGVTSIGNKAFYNCRALTSVTISDSVTSIGDEAFWGCSSLESVNYLGTIEEWCSISFGGEYANPLYYADDLYLNGKLLTEVVIPKTITEIKAEMFYGCNSLKSVTIPDSVTLIGKDAFRYCTSLESVIIGNSVTAIGDCAFYNCTSLKEITIPNSVTTIGKDAFRYCSSLESVNYLGTIEEWCSISFGGEYANPLYYADDLYLNGKLLTEVVIPNTLTTIKAYAFYGCTSLTSVNYLGTIEEWCNISFDGEYANPLSRGADFYINGRLVTNLVLPNEITNLQDYAFLGCTSLVYNEYNNAYYVGTKENPYLILIEAKNTQITSCTINENTKFICDWAFLNCNSLTNITIPDNVTIGDYAFTNCSCLTSVTIGKGAIIGHSAFSDCNSLVSITIPDGGISIGNYAFSHCDLLTSVTIGKGVTNIGDRAFSNCKSLTGIVIPNSVTSIGEAAFYGCTSLTSVTMGAGIKNVGNEVFACCDALTELKYNVVAIDDSNWGNHIFRKEENGTAMKVTIGKNVTKLPSYMFYSWTYPDTTYSAPITSVVFEEGSVCESIGDYAFYEVAMLTSITIPNSVTSIGKYAFYGCALLTSIEIPENVISIGRYTFSNCTTLETITMLDGIISIGESAFESSTSLTSIELPRSMKFVGSDAFKNCESLTEIKFNAVAMEDIGSRSYVFLNAGTNGDGIKVTIGKQVTKIPAHLFATPFQYHESYSPKITSVIFEDGCACVSIGECAFLYCNLLTSIEIPNTITSIGSRAFAHCLSLEKIKIPSGINRIEEATFYGCTSLTSAEIPNSVTSIGDHAFRGCISLTSITIPNSVTAIGDYAFSYSSLTSVIIPNSVTNIGDGAFDGCTSLKEITISNSVTTIGDCAFSHCDLLTSVTIGNGVTSIGEEAFSWCTLLTSIVIPNSVTNIGDDVFEGCHKLIEVYNLSTSLSTNADLNNYVKVVHTSLDKESILKTTTDGYVFAVVSDSEIYFVDYVGNETELTLPNSYNGNNYEIHKFAFSYRDDITKVTIPNSLTNIESSVFYNCTSLESVIIGNSVTAIGGEAFYNCTSLKEITIPNSVTTIGEDAFHGCTSLTSAKFENTSGWYVDSYHFEKNKNIDVTSTSTNATNLTSTYTNYYWYRK